MLFLNIFPGWNLCGHVFGDFTNINQSADGIFYFDNRIRFGFLHRSIEVKGEIIQLDFSFNKFEHIDLFTVFLSIRQ